MQGCPGGERPPAEPHQPPPAPAPVTSALDQAQFEADKRAVYKSVHTLYLYSIYSHATSIHRCFEACMASWAGSLSPL